MSDILTKFKYFMDADGNIHAFEIDGSQDDYIKPGLREVPTEEIRDRLIPPFNLAKAQIQLKHDVNLIYIRYMRELNVEYPQVERDTWSVQLAEANDLISNGLSAETPFIDSLIEGRDIDRMTMANKIIEKDAAYRIAAGRFTGIKQDHFKGIEALSLLPKESAKAACEAYDYNSGWSELEKTDVQEGAQVPRPAPEQ